MTGWQERVSVSERRAAALLALLVNARHPLGADDVFRDVPEYPGERTAALTALAEDAERLTAYGLAVTVTADGTVSIPAGGWQHRPVRLSDRDLALLDHVERSASPLPATAAAALAHLRGEPLAPEGPATISLSPRGSAARGRPVAYSRLHRLARLARNGQTAGFSYRDATGAFVPRQLQVAGLGEARGVWYAVGLEPGSAVVRAFAVTEMRGPVEALDQPGSYEPGGVDVREHLALAWRIGPDPFPARVVFDAGIAAFIHTMLQHLPLAPQPDGSVHAVFDVGDVDAFVGWVLSFGTHARITGPPNAVERARAALESVVGSHG